MSVIVATTRVACDTDTGEQDITTSACGGLIPKAAIFIATRAITDGTPADHAVMSIGFAVSSSERLVTAVSDSHGGATASTRRRMTEDECVMLLDPTDGTIDGEADFSVWITNGCTINWGDAPAAAYLLTVIFFCGTDVSAHVDTYQAPAVVDTAVDVTDPGFESDVVFNVTHRSSIDDLTKSHANLSWGCVVNDGSETQYSINSAGAHAYADATNSENSRSNRVAMNVFQSEEMESNEVTDFDSNGFSVYTRYYASAQDVGYLALNFNGAANVWLGDISSPTSGGDDAYTGPGFTPQAIILGIGRDPSFSDIDSNENQVTDIYSVGIGVATTTAEYSNVISSEDGAADMNTQSLSDNQVINQPEDSGGTEADLQATLGSSGNGFFDANGFTFNYSQVDLGSAHALWALAIEAMPRPVEIRTARQAVTTGSGAQYFDVSGWPAIPQLALYFITAATADNTPTDHSILGIGVAKSTSERATGGAIDVNGLGTTGCARRTISDECIVILDPSTGEVDGEADFVEFHAGGSEVNWGDSPSAAFLMTAVYFAGFDEFDLQKVDMSASSPQTVTVGFEADIVIVMATNGQDNDALHVNSELGMGFAVNGSGQGHIVGYGSNDVANGQPNRGISSTYFWGGASSSDWAYAMSIGSFDATGFDLTRSGTADITDDWFVMSLKLPTGLSAWVGAVASPTSGGDDPQTGPGFKPQALLGVISNIQTFNSWESDSAPAGGWAVTVATADDGSFCHAVANEKDAVTSDTQSLVDDTLIHLTDHDGTDQLIASLASFDTNGWTPNYSTYDSNALQQMWLAIEEDSAGDSFFKTLTDTIGITDALTLSVDKVITLLDSVGITDTLSKVGTFFKAFSESVGITDTFSTARDLIKSFSDSVGITDALSAVVLVIVALADTVGISDTLTKLRALARNLTDSVGITDVLTKIGTYKKTLEDTTGVADSLTTARGLVKTLSDTIGIADTIVGIKTEPYEPINVGSFNYWITGKGMFKITNPKS